MSQNVHPIGRGFAYEDLKVGFRFRTHRRTIAEWTAALERHGFAVTAEPMNGGTPFANVLLVGRKT